MWMHEYVATLDKNGNHAAGVQRKYLRNINFQSHWMEGGGSWRWLSLFLSQLSECVRVDADIEIEGPALCSTFLFWVTNLSNSWQ